METNYLDVKVKPKKTEMIGASFKGSEYIIYFSPSLFFETPPVMALDYISTYNAIHNIKNCSIEFNIIGLPNHLIKIPNGAYDITDLNKYVQEKLSKTITNAKNVFSILPQEKTGKSEIKILHPIDSVTINDPLKNVLGFTKNTLTSSNNVSKNNVNILSVNIINVEVSNIEGSTINGIKKPIIYSFFPDVQFGYKIIKDINNPFFLPTTDSTISRIYIRLTDQNNNLIDNNDELVDLRFLIQET